ncbi:hypothetical protein [Microcoleus sp.]
MPVPQELWEMSNNINSDLRRNDIKSVISHQSTVNSQQSTMIPAQAESI